MRVPTTLLIALSVCTLGAARESRVAAPPEEGWHLFRVQLAITTCTREHAGTDDAVFVELKDGQRMWLDYPRNDFESGDTFVYDVNLPHHTVAVGEIKVFGMELKTKSTESTVSDVAKLSLGKTGDNGWCVESLRLRLNNKDVFTKTFASGTWLDNAGGSDNRVLTIGGPDLRAHTLWQNAAEPSNEWKFSMMSELTRADLKSIVSARIGDKIHDTPMYWGHYHGVPVDVWATDDKTLHVDADLAAHTTGPNPDVDIDFNIKLGCPLNGDKYVMKMTNPTIDVESPLLVEVLTLGLTAIQNGVIQWFANNDAGASAVAGHQLMCAHTSGDGIDFLSSS